MTDRQTALLLRKLRDRLTDVRNGVWNFAMESDAASGRAVAQRTMTDIDFEVSEIDDDIRRLEAPRA